MVLEMVLFRLKDGVLEQDFVAAAKAVDGDVRQCKGFIGRQLYQNPDGHWVDLVQWQSQEDAEAAMQSVPQLPSFAAFAALGDFAKAQMLHVHPVQL
jgi:heme-degrading monooxygenase HmoA